MRRLPKPVALAADTLEACAKSIRDADLVGRLRKIVETVVSAEHTYIENGEQGTLHLIEGTDGVDGRVTTAEMERVYKGTFVKSRITRQIYGSIKSAPENDICPFCSQRTVSQLDHYLPQSAHPALTITPVNLLPVCSECNKAKLANEAELETDQVFHPYFEDADDGQWLYAKVVETAPPAISFYVQAPEHWDHVRAKRIVAHYKLYKLSELYAAHAAVELRDIRFGLMEMAKRNSVQEIRAHLRREATSRADAHLNSWRHATYQAIADSDWFCGGGFSI